MANTDLEPGPDARRSAADGGPPRVLVADNEALTGDAVAGALAVCGDFEVSVWRPTTGADTLAAVEAEAPDVVVIADQLVDANGPALTREILQREPGTKVIQVSLAYGRAQVEEALKAGAVGALPKGGIDVATLVDGVHEAMAGAVPVFADRTQRAVERIEQRGGYLADKAQRLARLTPRQLEVLRLLDEGLDIRRVARQLGLAEATVQRHIHNILRSLDVQTQVEAVAVARDLDYL